MAGFRAVKGSWNTMPIPAPRMLAERRLGQGQEVGPLEAERARGSRRLGQEPDQSQRQQRFAGPGFADDPQRFAALDLEADILQDRQRRPGRPLNRDGEVSNLEQRRRDHPGQLPRRSSRSRRPSPRRLRPRTANATAPPGTITSQGAWAR